MGDSKYTVAGVCGDARVTQDRDAAEAYSLAGESDMAAAAVLVATSGRPESSVSSVAAIAKGIDPKVLPEVQLMKRSFEQKLQGTAYSALAVSLLALVALLLACLGIVGLVSYAVSQRTKEIGIRMALGAKPSQILSIALSQLSRPVLAGLAAGAAGAAALSQVLRQILFGIGAFDLPAYLGAIALFIGIAALAALLPARRALRVDPMRALRND